MVKSFAKYYIGAMEDVCKAYKTDIFTPWNKLPKNIREVLLYEVVIF